MRLRYRSGTPTIRVTINGKGCTLLVDTGATQSFLDKGLAKKLKFKIYETDQKISGIGGSETVFSTSRLTISGDDGPLNIKMKAINFARIRKGFGIAGVVGSDFLRKNDMIINYKENTLT